MDLAVPVTFVLGKLCPIVLRFLIENWLGSDRLEADLLTETAKEGSAWLGKLVGSKQAPSKTLESIARGITVDLMTACGVPEHEQPMVASLVSDALESALRDPRILVRHNFDASRVSHEIAEQLTNGLSEQEELLSRRVIDKLVRRVIDVLWDRTGFQTTALQELLERSDEAASVAANSNRTIDELGLELHRLYEIAQRLDRHYTRLANTQSKAEDKFIENYLESVKQQLDRMQLHGISVSRESKNHPLTVAYIKLSAVVSGVGEPQNVDIALAGHNRVLIRGEAGSGKTTLMRWLAVRAASKDFEGPLLDWNSLIPIVLPLRNTIYQSTDDGPLELRFPEVQGFIPLCFHPIQEPSGSNITANILLAGKGLVLIDGVDEVPEPLRERALDYVNTLVNFYSESTFIITSRPYAISDTWHRQQGFRELHLEDLNIDDIHRLIDKWHSAVASELTRIGQESDCEILGEQAHRFKAQIRAKRSLFELARKPLLCAVLCALNRDRNSVLPDGRIELYEACLDLLLTRRDPERGIKGQQAVRIDSKVKVGILQYVAYWFMVNGLSEAPSDAIEGRIGRRLPHFLLPESIEGKSAVRVIREYLVQRSGVIREPAVGRVDWVHNTFKEFLAAKEVVEEDCVPDLLSHANDDRWNEVLVFVIGIGNATQRKKIFQHLLESQSVQAGFLAGAGLELCTSLDPELRTRVMSRLQIMIPPKNIGQSRQIALAGNAAVAFLVVRFVSA